MQGTTTGASDADTVAASLSEPERFGAIFDRHAVAVHAFLARRAGRDLADDLLGEVFAVAFDGRSRYDRAWPDARGWLYGIAHNVLRNRLRGEARRLRLLAGLPVEGPVQPWDDVDAALDAASPGRAAATALLDLPDAERQVMELLAWEDLPVAEVARVLGIPAGTARSRLHRARTALKAALETTTGGTQ